VEKKVLLTAAFISAILFSVVAGTQFPIIAKGNPFSQSVYSGERYPSVTVKAHKVSVLSPQNDMVYGARDILLSLNVSTKGLESFVVGDFHYISSIEISEVSFAADWLSNETMIYRKPRMEEWIDKTAKFFFMGVSYDKYEDLPKIDFENLTLTLTNVPDGNHTIRVYAVGSGSEHTMFNWYAFYITRSAKVNFVVDTTPPKVTILSLENKTYHTSDLPLNFTTNDPVSQIAYSLDGRANVTLSGNMTLSELSAGLHNVTVYANDVAGNVGASETIYFSVEEPFPTTRVMAPIASVAIVGMGLLVYFRKRRVKSGDKA